MNAAPLLIAPPETKTALGLAKTPMPAELLVLLEESPKMHASFMRLSDRDRGGFVRYIEEPKSVLTRERRAALVAMSLMGLARDLRDDGSRI